MYGLFNIDNPNPYLPTYFQHIYPIQDPDRNIWNFERIKAGGLKSER